MSTANRSSDDGASGAANATTANADEVRKAFSALPFEQKISTLFRIELDIIGDAAESVISAVSSAVDEIASACAQSSNAEPSRASDSAG